MKPHTRLLRTSLLLPFVLLLAACSDDDDPMGSTAGVAGDYSTTTFTLREGTNPVVNMLARGGSIEVTLTATGGVTGQMIIPDTPEFGDAFTTNLVGTFTVTGSTLRFTQSADTFIRDFIWTIEGQTLTSSGDAGGGILAEVTLTRQGT